jgi:tetratricopeptide (TPR) repeat protein
LYSNENLKEGNWIETRENLSCLEKIESSNQHTQSVKLMVRFADCLKIQGDVYYHSKEYELALEKFKQASQTYVKYNIIEKLSIVNVNIAIICHFHKNDGNEAFQMLTKAIEIFSKLDLVKELEKGMELLDLIKKRYK